MCTDKKNNKRLIFSIFFFGAVEYFHFKAEKFLINLQPTRNVEVSFRKLSLLPFTVAR